MLEKECVVKAYSEINSFAMRVRLPCRLQKEDKISCPLFVINYNIGTLFFEKIKLLIRICYIFKFEAD